MTTTRSAARSTRVVILLLCALVGLGLRALPVVRRSPASPLVAEQRLIAAGAHLLEYGDVDVTAFRDDTPLAAYAASLPWLGVRAGLPPRDPTGPPEQVGWTALYGTPSPAAAPDEHPREVLPAAPLLLAARLPSLVAFLLALVATVFLAEALFGRWAALIAGVVLALDPVTAVAGGFAGSTPWAQACTAWLLLAAAAHWETVVGGTDRRPGRERRGALTLGAALGFALLASVTVWPVAIVTLLWLGARAGAATRRGDAFRRGSTGRVLATAVACAVVLALGCMVVHARVLVQPAVDAVSQFDGVAGEAFREAGPFVAWPALFALVAAPWLYRDRVDSPALLIGAAATAVAVAAVAPARLVLPALAAASPAIAVLAGCGIARVGHRSRPVAAALALLLLVPLAGAAALRVATFEPAEPTDHDHDAWFVTRLVEQRRPRALHIMGLGDSAVIEIREATRIVRAPRIDSAQVAVLLGEDGAVVALPHPVPAALADHVIARARGIVFLE